MALLPPSSYRVDMVENVFIPSLLRLFTRFDTALNLSSTREGDRGQYGKKRKV